MVATFYQLLSTMYNMQRTKQSSNWWLSLAGFWYVICTTVTPRHLRKSDTLPTCIQIRLVTIPLPMAGMQLSSIFWRSPNLPRDTKLLSWISFFNTTPFNLLIAAGVVNHGFSPGPTGSAIRELSKMRKGHGVWLSILIHQPCEPSQHLLQLRGVGADGPLTQEGSSKWWWSSSKPCLARSLIELFHDE